MMPGMSGYEVCRAIRADPAHAMLPVVLVTALDPAQERVKGLDAGADDFLSKPVSQAELLARVRSLLRIKSLYDEVQRQKSELAELEPHARAARRRRRARSSRSVGRLKRFFSPQLAELIVAGGADDPLKSHRREITVVFLDLRGFTAFTETADPEEVMGVLGEYHAAIGGCPRARRHARALHRRRHHGVLQRPGAGARPGAARGAHGAARCSARWRAWPSGWSKRGYDAARWASASRRASRPSAASAFRRPHRLRRDRHRHQPGGAPVRRSAQAARSWSRSACCASLDDEVATEPAGELVLKGFHKPVPAFRVRE